MIFNVKILCYHKDSALERHYSLDHRRNKLRAEKRRWNRYVLPNQAEEVVRIENAITLREAEGLIPMKKVH